MPADDPRAARQDDARRFRRTLVRVMIVQALSLIALWLLQTRFSA